MAAKSMTMESHLQNKNDGLEVQVKILNRAWIFKGFKAIAELASFMDEHANDVNAGGTQPQPYDVELPVAEYENVIQGNGSG